MAVDFSTAVNAYRQAANATGAGKTTAAASAGEEDRGSFASMVTDSLQQAVKDGRQAETLSMKQIADRVGFTSASRFDRNFKDVCGIPPTEYRISGSRRSQRATTQH